MKYYYRFKEFQYLEHCTHNDFDDRQVCIGSATCIEDCPYLISYSTKEEYVVCSKLNKIDREKKLERIIDEMD